MQPTSATLLAKLRDPRDRAAWERLVRDYTPLLLEYARQRRILNADDFVQNVFGRVFEKLPQYDRARGRFRDWLRAILRNDWLHQVRADSRRVPLDAANEPAVDPRRRDDEAEGRGRLVALALELIKRDFEPGTVDLFTECEIGGRRPVDVARERGLKPGTVYVAISRVYKRLREELPSYDQVGGEP